LYLIKERKLRKSKLLSLLTLLGHKKRNNLKTLVDYLRPHNPLRYPKGDSLIVSNSVYKVFQEGNNQMLLFVKIQPLLSISWVIIKGNSMTKAMS
jgi:hypothetical protein